MAIPSPKAILRILINVCLVGAGACAIGQASRISHGHGRADWLHDLAIFFFFALIAFVLFFAEYQLFQGLTKRDLNMTLGYVQAIGCLLLLLSGVWSIYYFNGKPMTAPNSGYQENALLYMYVFGQLAFIGNVIWSYLHEEKPS